MINNPSKRIIHLTGCIDYENSGVVDLYEKLNSYLIEDKNLIEKTPIYIYINSYGGDFPTSHTLYNYIKKFPIPIYTFCSGQAYSGGFIVFLSGHKRYVTEGALLMFHGTQTEHFACPFEGLKKYVDTFKVFNETFINLTLNETKIPRTLLEESVTTQNDLYLFADDIKKYGIAEII